MWGEFLAAHVGHLVLLAALLALSAHCSASETALFSLSPGRLYRMRRGGRGGQLVVSLMARPQEILSALLLSNLLINTALSSVAAVMVLELARPEMQVPAWAVPVLSAAPALLLIVCGDLLPKTLALLVGESWAVAAAPVLAIQRRALLWIIRLLHVILIDPLTRILAPRAVHGANIDGEELTALLDMSAKRGVIDSQTGVLLREIVELTDIRVADIMVPRVDMICYDVDAPRAGLVKLLVRTRLRRIPVYERDVDHILGVIQAKRVLLEDAPLRQLVMKVPFVPEAANLERTLLQLRVRRAQMAVVVDEYGGTAGLVTMEDILEEIVGDIPDRFEKSGPAVQQIAPGRYLVDGDLPIREWADAFALDLAGGRISTVGGFVTSLLGRIARVGDQAAYRNLQFTVRSMRRRRIGQLELQLVEGRS